MLDGQQRLTALSRVRDGDDEYPLMFCTWQGERKTEMTLSFGLPENTASWKGCLSKDAFRRRLESVDARN